MERLNLQSRSDRYGSRINRDHSPWRARSVPWLSIMAGSLVPTVLLADVAPLVPPLGFLMLLGWRLVRPGLLPLWAGAPLGAFDDLYSGQPFGCAMVLWSLALITLELLEARSPWRGFWRDWSAAGLVAVVYVLSALALAGIPISAETLRAVLPQGLLSVLLYPIITRMVAELDRFRLARSRRIG